MSLDDNRRGGMRHLTCYPIHIQKGEAGETSDVEIAVIGDLSASGAFLLSRDELPIGGRVKLHLDVFGEAGELHIAIGHVVRTEKRPVDRADVWPYGIAVQFDEAHPELEPAIAELAKAVRPRPL